MELKEEAALPTSHCPACLLLLHVLPNLAPALAQVQPSCKVPFSREGHRGLKRWHQLHKVTHREESRLTQVGVQTVPHAGNTPAVGDPTLCSLNSFVKIQTTLPEVSTETHFIDLGIRSPSFRHKRWGVWAERAQGRACGERGNKGSFDTRADLQIEKPMPREVK